MIYFLLFLFFIGLVSILPYEKPKQGRLNDFGFTAFVVGSIIAAAGTAKSVQQQRRAASSQRKAQEEQLKRQQAADARERARQVREARVARARAQQAIENQGAGGSSIASGALGSIQTQLGSNLGFQANQQASVLTQSGFMQDAASARSSAATGQAIAGLGQTVMTNSDRIGSIFD
jgi:hypothetical protein